MAKTGYLRTLMAIVAALLAAALLAVANPVAAQTAPPGLGGETLEGDPTITNCNVSVFGGTFTYKVSGVATGPYPGTFTERGTVAVGPEDEQSRQEITDLSASFSISSPNGDVVGTKVYVPNDGPYQNPATGECSEGFFGESNSGRAFVYYPELVYQAKITTPDGQTCTQEGFASLSLVEGSSVLPDSFTESFYNDLNNPNPSCEGGEDPPPPPPDVPTTKEACKDAGFEDFAALGFKNQGQCVAFVERGPKESKKVK